MEMYSEALFRMEFRKEKDAFTMYKKIIGLWENMKETNVLKLKLKEKVKQELLLDVFY